MTAALALSIAQQVFALCSICQFRRRSNTEKLNVVCMCTLGGCVELADIYADCISQPCKEPCEQRDK